MVRLLKVPASKEVRISSMIHVDKQPRVNIKSFTLLCFMFLSPIVWDNGVVLSLPAVRMYPSKCLYLLVLCHSPNLARKYAN